MRKAHSLGVTQLRTPSYEHNIHLKSQRTPKAPHENLAKKPSFLYNSFSRVEITVALRLLKTNELTE